jgi:hypothetical protein
MASIELKMLYIPMFKCLSMEKLKVDTFSKNDECFVFLQHLKTGDQKDFADR